MTEEKNPYEKKNAPLTLEDLEALEKNSGLTKEELEAIRSGGVPEEEEEGYGPDGMAIENHRKWAWRRECRAMLRPLESGTEYADESEHQDGYGYWDEFATLDDVKTDYDLYVESVRVTQSELRGILVTKNVDGICDGCGVGGIGQPALRPDLVDVQFGGSRKFVACPKCLQELSHAIFPHRAGS